ncbi:MAG: ribbon-helix-helix protein, CopG family [Verrucomicrobiales bacterium]
METTLTGRLDEEAARELDEAAARTGRSKGEIVRELIRTNLRRAKPSALDAMRDCVGIVKHAPRDLSTNKRYLKNLGRGKVRW